MRRILAGLDTEYGFSVEGRGAEDQLEDAKALVRSYPGERFPFWDDRFESPRSDLRGFRLDRLSFDPDDAQFDAGRSPVPDVRSDHVLLNGARFYNDHGHPEYATPETWSIAEAVLHDKAGDLAVAAAAEVFGATRVYKNNTDFHGASYGTHESYLVPRSIGIEALVVGLMPLFVARQVLCGAGKVGAEQGARCDYQMSQRADFFSDLVSAETLYRRPIFNTRDEPHADPAKWMRLHVICGESNMSPTACGMKLALVKAALHLVEAGAQPVWRLADPLRAIKSVSRDVDGEGRIELEGASWTTPRQVLESYAEAFLRIGGDEELESWMELALALLEARTGDPDRFARSVDWAAKRMVLEMATADGVAWSDPYMQALDLEYHRIDGRQGLAFALQEMGALDPDPNEENVKARTTNVFEDTRARARSIALAKFRESLLNLSWGSLTFRTNQGDRTVLLPPDKEYPATLERCETVEAFIMELQA